MGASVLSFTLPVAETSWWYYCRLELLRRRMDYELNGCKDMLRNLDAWCEVSRDAADEGI